MDNILENNDDVQFANGQNSRDLRASSENLHDQTNSIEPLEALRRDSDEVIERRIELPDGPGRKSGRSGGSPWHRRITERVVFLVLLVLAVGAVSPLAWNYLQSFESTDDAQIDGHIDPLSSRINGTVISVHAEDNDRVKAGELLVEIDPQQAAMLAFMDCFHLLAIVVLAGLPLALLIKHFEIGKAAAGGH